MQIKKNNSLSIIIPILNEKNNLRGLVKRIYQNTTGLKKEIIFIDDNSEDDSISELRILKKKLSNLRYFVRLKNRDLTQSCFLGIKKSKNKNILIMDGDGQHNPIYIKGMFNLFLKKKADFVVGTRDFREIGESLSFIRFLASKILIFILDITLKRKTADPMSGFFIFKKIFYKKNKKLFFGKGYKILADFIYSSKKKLKIYDYKIKFKVRKKGKSKMSFKVLIILIYFIIKKIIRLSWWLKNLSIKIIESLMARPLSLDDVNHKQTGSFYLHVSS